jgi:pseudaminic acid cytidylyltransferase
LRLALIPARGGSKRIPRKNIRPFAGNPMIAWSIRTALESACFDRVIVSTDDEEIADVGRRFGAEVPFVRPPEISDDHTSTAAVVAHALRWLQAQGESPLAACCLYATAPFVLPGDLVAGRRALEALDCDFALAVTGYASPIQRAVRFNQAGLLEMFQPQFADTRSQDMEPAYHDAGQFCWGRADSWLAGNAVLASRTAPVFIPAERVQDIDTPEDWDRAEWKFNALRRGAARE